MTEINFVKNCYNAIKNNLMKMNDFWSKKKSQFKKKKQSKKKKSKTRQTKRVILNLLMFCQD